MGKLRDKGYVRIDKGDKDRRNSIISLTEEGRRLKERAVDVPKTLIDEQWLTNEEIEVFKALLYKLLQGDWGK